jgi:hypothetical protein
MIAGKDQSLLKKFGALDDEIRNFSLSGITTAKWLQRALKQAALAETREAL